MEIQKRNLVDRYRIRHSLKHFLKKLGSATVDEYSLKLKYLTELTGIIPTLGSETYQVNHSAEHAKSAPTHVRVNGETGIQTCTGSHADGAQVRKLPRESRPLATGDGLAEPVAGVGPVLKSTRLTAPLFSAVADLL